MTDEQAREAAPAAADAGVSPEFAPALQVTIARVRDEIAAIVESLSASADGPDGLTLSIRVPGADLFLIRRVDGSEVSTLCDLEATAIPRTPGSTELPLPEALAHAAAYRKSDVVGAIVQTALEPGDDAILFIGPDAATAVARATGADTA